MSYSRFQDLPVWRDSVQLAADVFRFTLHPVFHYKGDLANQLQRAALSVSNNIAEGFERQTNRELLQFIYFAKGSAGECLSMCAVMHELDFLQPHAETISRLEGRLTAISRQLGAWAASQRDGEIDGSRFLSARERERREQEARRTALLEKIKRVAESAAKKNSE
jgi:four helix bundle protein